MTTLNITRTLMVGFTVLCSTVLSLPAMAAPRLNGLAVHSELGQEQFIAALYSNSLSSDARQLILLDEDKAMEIRVLADTLFPRRLQRMWIEGIAINAGTNEMERHAQHLADFSNLLRVRMVAGDILRIERQTRADATRISLNGHPLDTIPSRQFFDLLARVWLGPVPLSSTFKDNLLAAGQVDNALAARFQATAPTPERTASVIAALDAARTTRRPPGRTDEPEVATTPPAATPAPAIPAPVVPTPPPEPTVTTVPPPPAAEEDDEIAEPATLATAATLFQNDSLFDDDDEDFSFTAEKLLSEQIYISRLTKWTSGFVRYPRASLRSEQQGTVRVTVSLRRDGRVADVQLLESSEYEQLNRAAVRAVRSASPYPAVPDEIAGDPFLFTVPVVFRLN